MSKHEQRLVNEIDGLAEQQGIDELVALMHESRSREREEFGGKTELERAGIAMARVATSGFDPEAIANVFINTLSEAYSGLMVCYNLIDEGIVDLDVVKRVLSES